MSHRSIWIGPRILPLLAASLASFGCGAGVEDTSEEAELAQTSEALVTAAISHVRTPAVKNTSTYQTVTCSDCAPQNHNVAWSTIDTGDYLVKFPGLAPSSATPYVLHVSPFGTQGAECTINRSRTGISGNDMIVGVSCTNALGSDIDTRFQVSYFARSASEPVLANPIGFARVINNALNGWYVSASPAATLQKLATGQYLVSFPGLKSTTKGGNAQVTSWTKGKRCVPLGWEAKADTGTKIWVQCATTFNVISDADFAVTHYQENAQVQATSAYVWSQNASNFTTEKPAPLWNRSFGSGDPNLLSSGVEVKRLSAGRYQLDFRRVSHGRTNQSVELSAVNNVENSCVVMNSDNSFAEVQCVKNGSPSNSQFSMRVTTGPVAAAGWKLTSTVNLFENFGLGWGVLCGQVAIETRQIMCARPSSPGTLEFPRVTGPELWPTAARYVAVDNRDVTNTRVLVLGSDRVLRASTGNLTKTWPAADNFATQTVVAQPSFSPGGGSLSLRKITVVRGTSSNFVMALTDDNRVVELSGTVWVASSFPIPSGVTWRTISGGPNYLSLLAIDGRMYRATRSAASATQLPALPNSLRAIGIGGDFVLTNANMNASGLVPCVTPKDSAGYYNCGSKTQRFLMLTDYGTWRDVVIDNIPLTNADSVLTNGNPLTAFPSVEDARILHGDSGASLLTGHYNARVYHFL